MSYFSATMKVNSEGDVLVSDDTIQGLGTAQRFLNFFFGSLLLVARTPPNTFPSDYNAPLEMASPPTPSIAHSQMLPPRPEGAEKLDASLAEVHTGLVESFGTVLIACVPHAGYFVAGGIAGIVSRTSTAPLDRLKVYLIAQTGAAAEEAVAAAKSGNVFRAGLNAWKPLATAMKELWQAGGMRSLYAGKCSKTRYARGTNVISGNGLNVIKVMPESAIKFGSYEAAKRLFAKVEGHNDPQIIHSWSKFVAGGMAGMVSQFAVYPIDTLKL
jgi:solute carrier family 25 phosphate transporter 23/24/25/41